MFVRLAMGDAEYFGACCPIVVANQENAEVVPDEAVLTHCLTTSLRI